MRLAFLWGYWTTVFVLLFAPRRQPCNRTLIANCFIFSESTANAGNYQHANIIRLHGTNTLCYIIFHTHHTPQTWETVIRSVIEAMTGCVKIVSPNIQHTICVPGCWWASPLFTDAIFAYTRIDRLSNRTLKTQIGGWAHAHTTDALLSATGANTAIVIESDGKEVANVKRTKHFGIQLMLFARTINIDYHNCGVNLYFVVLGTYKKFRFLGYRRVRLVFVGFIIRIGK